MLIENKSSQQSSVHQEEEARQRSFCARRERGRAPRRHSNGVINADMSNLCALTSSQFTRAHLCLLTLVPGSLVRRRIRLLSESFETAVEVLKSALAVAQVLRSPVLVFRVLRRLGRILIVLAVAVLLHRIHGLEDLRSPEEAVAPSHRRVLVRWLHRVRHGTDHSYVGDVGPKPATAVLYNINKEKGRFIKLKLTLWDFSQLAISTYNYSARLFRLLDDRHLLTEKTLLSFKFFRPFGEK